jgi:predicted permease
MSGAQPPRWAERLLRAVLPAAERDHVLGDLREEFEADLRRAGVWRARVSYAAEAARSLWPLITWSGRRKGRVMTGWQQDLRGALRVFVQAPGFAAVVVLTLGIGVGSAAAVYSVVSGVLLSPLPFPESERVVMLWGRTPEYPRAPLTVGDHNALATGVEAFDGVGANWSNTALILGEGDAEQVGVGWVTPGYLELLGIRPALGRTLAPDDGNTILIDHDLWARRYGADPAVIGSVVNLSGDSFELAGVLPADMDPNLTAFSGAATRHQVWRLMPPDWLQGDDRTVGWLRGAARLRDGVALSQAQAEVDSFMARLNATVTERDGGTDLSIDLIPARADLVGGVSRTLWILMAAVCGVLLIAATNVAHLMLGRGELRSGEVAVRLALGGSRLRLVRQLLVESGVLAAAGALAGMLVAWGGVRGLLAFAPSTLPRLELVRLDAGVLAFALLATALTAVVFGLIPAFRVTAVDSSSSLGRRHAGGDRRQQRLSRGLVVAQVALSVALVSGTGLLIRSIGGLRAVDLGFDTDGVVTFALEAPDWGGDDATAAARMRDYIARIETIPGVRHAGFTNRVPLGGGLFTGTFRSEDMVAAEAPTHEAAVRYVTSGYLDALGARLLAGRNLRDADPADVVVVDENTAARSWPDANPIGRRLQISAVGGDAQWAEVVGVVAAMRNEGVAQAAVATLFLPMLPRANQQNFRYLAVRVDGDPLAHLDPLRAAVRAVEADAVIARVRTMRELFDDDVAATRFATLLLSLFGGCALLLAAVGLHGVMAVSMRSRRREMGIRMALGARPALILRAALASGLALVVLGIAAGMALALGLGRMLESLLYGVRPSDPLTLIAAAALILGVGGLGAWLPAQTVLGVDPSVTLRED